MKPSATWLLWRSILALLLTIGFYGLAIGLIILLVMIPYWEITYLDRLDGRILLGCLFGAFAIAWAIFPRIDKFLPPGPRLESKKHPRLFALISEVAKSAGQTTPGEVYLVGDVNAFVAERGGMMGVGARRVMGLGLPLLQLLSVSELKGVLAHEFGHYHGGDTALGPWIYKLRNTIIRTVAATGQSSSIVQIPFRWYGDMFLRVTNSISRAQEFAADALAASITGSQPLIDSLKKIHRGALGLQAFYQQEYFPALNAGYRPPLAAGFKHFMNAAGISLVADRLLDEEMSQGKQNPYDTHPLLRERIAALKNTRPIVGLNDQTSAIALLENVDDAERELLLFMSEDKSKAAALRRENWENLAEKVFLPNWQKTAIQSSSHLKGVLVGDLPGVIDQLGVLARNLNNGITPIVPAGVNEQEFHLRIVSQAVGTSLSTHLAALGWKIETMPGEPVVFRKDGLEIDPFGVLGNIKAGKIRPEDWKSFCTKTGIAIVDLGKLP